MLTLDTALKNLEAPDGEGQQKMAQMWSTMMENGGALRNVSKRTCQARVVVGFI